jgi:hypothetical protein
MKPKPNTERHQAFHSAFHTTNDDDPAVIVPLQKDAQFIRTLESKRFNSSKVYIYVK